MFNLLHQSYPGWEGSSNLVWKFKCINHRLYITNNYNDLNNILCILRIMVKLINPTDYLPCKNCSHSKKLHGKNSELLACTRSGCECTLYKGYFWIILIIRIKKRHGIDPETVFFYNGFFLLLINSLNNNCEVKHFYFNVLDILQFRINHQITRAYIGHPIDLYEFGIK